MVMGEFIRCVECHHVPGAHGDELGVDKTPRCFARTSEGHACPCTGFREGEAVSIFDEPETSEPCDRPVAQPSNKYEDASFNPFVGWPGHKRYYELLMECARIHATKNLDYADDASDPLANFRGSEAFGVSAADGCLTRLSDKWKRLCSLVRKERRGEAPAVPNEGVNDTCLDGANYFLIFRILREEKGL